MMREEETLKEIESLSNGNGLVHLVLTQQIKDYNYIILNLKQDRLATR